MASSTTPYAGSFALPDGSTLKGGYSKDTWERNIALNTTTIRSNSIVPLNLVHQSLPTLLSGFVVENIYAENNQDLLALNIESVSRNTVIEDNTIRMVEPPSSGGRRYVVKCHSGCNARFMRNYIDGKECHKSTRAFYIVGGSFPELVGNTIYTGTGNSPEFALDIWDNATGRVVLRENTIIGGLGPSNAYAVGVSSGELIADNNLFIGGQTSLWDATAFYAGSGAIVVLTNNRILGGANSNTSGRALALELYNSDTIATNNLLMAGPARGSANAAIKIAAAGAVRLTNNLVLTDGYHPRQALREEYTGYIPQSVENNIFWHLSDLGTRYFYTAYGTGTCATGCNDLTFQDKTDWTAGNDKARANYVFPEKVLPFVRAPLLRDATIANNTGSGSVLKVTNCTPYIAGEYIEWARDGTARQIIACSSGDLQIGTAISPTQNLLGREIRLWGNRSSNYTFDFRPTQTTLSTTDWNTLRYGGLAASQPFCGAPAGGPGAGPGGSSCGGVVNDADGVVRTAQHGALANNTSGSGGRRDGFSIGPYEVE